MPELPDVEVFRRYLDATALHKEIEKVAVLDEDLLAGTSAAEVRRALEGTELEETARHGKYLFVSLRRGPWLVLHFGMTGKLKYFEKGAAPDHTRLLLDFRKGGHLSFQNQRKFGSIDLTEQPSDFLEAHDLGPDALDLGWPDFKEAFSGRRGSIKSALMDQSLIAGIGNVYADEICFQAGIYPGTRMAAIDEETLHKIHLTMRRVLRTAIDRQADVNELPRSWLLPHRRKTASCPRCDGEIRKRQVAGRPTYFCPSCQPER